MAKKMKEISKMELKVLEQNGVDVNETRITVVKYTYKGKFRKADVKEINSFKKLSKALNSYKEDFQYQLSLVDECENFDIVENKYYQLIMDTYGYSDEMIKKMKEKEAEKLKRGKSVSIKTLKFSFNMLWEDKDGRVNADIHEAQSILVQHSNLIQLVKDNVLFDVFTIDLKHDRESVEQLLMVEKCIMEGIWINGVCYKALMRTASQGRVSKLYIAPAHKRWAYRTALNYGTDLRTLPAMNPDKREARMGTRATSGTLMAAMDEFGCFKKYDKFSYKLVRDTKMKLKLHIMESEEHVDEDGRTQITDIVKNHRWLKGKERLAVADGQGLIDVIPCVKINYRLGNITLGEYTYFMTNYSGLNGKSECEIQSSNPKLHAIIKKLSTQLMIRHGFMKGLVVMHDLKACGIKEDFLIPESINKIEGIDYKEHWLIAESNKQKPKYSKFFYQGLMNLYMLEPNDIYGLADESVEHVTRVFKGAQEAIEVLNLYDNGQDSNLGKVLNSLKINPECYTSSYIQDGLKKFVTKSLHEIAIGKIVIEGAFHYMVQDPSVLINRELLTLHNTKIVPGTSTGRLSKKQTDNRDKLDSVVLRSKLRKNPVMKAGEYHHNGLTQDTILVRTPCVSAMEPQRVTLSNVERAWYLRDAIIFNSFEGRWIGMGGADFDGDKCLVILTPKLVENRIHYKEYLHMVVIKTPNASSKEVETDEVLDTMYLRGVGGSNVGQLSNMASLYSSMMEHQGHNLPDYTNGLALWMMYIGKEIDKVKTGEVMDMDEKFLKLTKKYHPKWAAAVKYLKGCQKPSDYIVNLEECWTNAAYEKGYDNHRYADTDDVMGMLFKHMTTKYKLFNGKDPLNNMINPDDEAFLSSLKKVVPVAGLDDAMDIVKEMHDAYKSTIGAIINNYRDNTEAWDQSQELDSEVITLINAATEYHKDLFNIKLKEYGLNAFTATYAALALVKVRNDKKKDSIYGYKAIPTSYSYAFNVCYEYLERMLIASSNNMIPVLIPNTESTRVEIKGSKMLVNGIERSFNNIINDSFYDVKKDYFGRNYILVEEGVDTTPNEAKDSIINDRGAYININAIEEKTFITIGATSTYQTNPLEVATNIAGKKVTIIEDGKYFVLCIVDGEELKCVCPVMNVDSSMVGRVFYTPTDVVNFSNFTTSKETKRKYSDGSNMVERVDLVVYKEASIDKDIMDKYEIINRVTITDEYDLPTTDHDINFPGEEFVDYEDMPIYDGDMGDMDVNLDDINLDGMEFSEEYNEYSEDMSDEDMSELMSGLGM